MCLQPGSSLVVFGRKAEITAMRVTQTEAY